MKLLEDVSLAEHSTLGLGGPARYLAIAEHEQDVASIVRWARRQGLDLAVLGGGSNVVVSDAGVDAVVLKIALRGLSWDRARGRVEAGAGEPWDDLVAQSVARGWAGLECLSGIPGHVGATPIQNVGAYGQEVHEVIRSVRVYDRQLGSVQSLSNEACRFGYRDSLFKSIAPERFVVLAVQFQLGPSGKPAIRHARLAKAMCTELSPTLAQVRDHVLALRRAKGMLWTPHGETLRSCGSFFVNPVVDPEIVSRVRQASAAEPPTYPQPDGRIKIPAAWLIEHAGFGRGHSAGRVGLSPHHALCIVCHAGATASDVVEFARAIHAAVHERFGVVLVPEPSFFGFGEALTTVPAFFAT
ncbi:MAG: UDP-N-acetylmuramate dehydrogenase [Polyangiaceae bacterium]|nr:UDP-N-acetylmuramate dehydrogenase [Polyangiaceae bacterium]